MSQVKDRLSCSIKFYNSERFHQSVGCETPEVIYRSKLQEKGPRAVS